MFLSIYPIKLPSHCYLLDGNNPHAQENYVDCIVMYVSDTWFLIFVLCHDKVRLFAFHICSRAVCR